MSFWRAVNIRAAAIVIAVGVLFSAYVLARPMAILLASVIIAVALEPLVQRLQRWLPRGAAAIVVYAALVLFILLLFAVVGVTAVSEFDDVVDDLPTNQAELTDLINRYDPFGDGRLIEIIRNQRSTANSVALQIPLQVSSAIVEIVIAFFLSIYWVLAAPALRKFALSLFADDRQRQKASDLIDSMGSTMGGYVRAIAIDGVLLATATYIGLSLLGVQFPLVLALISGLAVLVPIIGPIAAAVPAILIALIDSPLKAAMVLAFYIILQQIESNILLPKIMQRQADIHPLLGVFAVFAGGSIGGILGALIAVPTAGAILVIIRQLIAPAIRESERPEIVTPAAQPDEASD